jgi:hypothetical protein
MYPFEYSVDHQGVDCLADRHARDPEPVAQLALAG